MIRLQLPNRKQSMGGEMSTPVCDKNKVDAGWIIATHSNGELVPLKIAESLETQLNHANKAWAREGYLLNEISELKAKLAKIDDQHGTGFAR